MLLPIILDAFFINAIGILTTAMISTSSQESVAAVSLVNPIAIIIYAVISALATGGTILTAQYAGQGETEKIKKTAGQVVGIVVAASFFMSLLILFSTKYIVQILFIGADPVIVSKAAKYLAGVSVSMVFLAAYLGAFSVFRGIGDTKTCLKLTVMVNLLHLFLSFLFLNILRMDIVGTALSLIIARAAGGTAGIYLLIRKRGKLKIPVCYFFKMEKSMVKNTFGIGAPYALEQIFFNGGSMIVQIFLVSLGTVYISAYAVANSFLSIVYAAGMAVGTLSMTVVGQCLGAGKKDDAGKYGKNFCALGQFVIIISLAVFIPLMPVILKLYQAPDNTVILIQQLIYVMVIPLVLFWPVSGIMPCVLRAGGDSMFCSLSSLIIMWIVRVLAGYILTVTMRMGIIGLWVTMPLEWLIRTVIYWRRFRYTGLRQ